MHARGQVLDLDTGVVVVELTRHRPSGALEERGDGVAHRRLPPVSDVQRARRVGRHELHHDTLALPGVAVPVLGVRANDVDQWPRARVRICPKIDEAWTRHVRSAHARTAKRKALHNRGGESARLPAQRAREYHREIGRPVAERSVARPFNDRLEGIVGAELLRHALELVAEQLPGGHSRGGFDFELGAAG